MRSANTVVFLLDNIRDGYDPTQSIAPKAPRLNGREDRKIPSDALVMWSTSGITGKTTQDPDFE